MNNQFSNTLTFADGVQWQIIVDNDLQEWFSKVEPILKLDRLKKSPLNLRKIYIQRMEDDRSESEDDPATNSLLIKGTGWSLGIDNWNSIISSIEPYNGDYYISVKYSNEECEYYTIWYSLFPFYFNALLNGGLAFHAGLISRNGNGFLLGGTGGAGKSTACNRLPPGWQSHSDDETLIVLNENKEYHSHPFPTWSDFTIKKQTDKSWDVQYSVPLKAVFFLEQSSIVKATPVKKMEAAYLIMKSSSEVYFKYIDRMDRKDAIDLRGRMFANACRLSNQVPAYRLQMTLDGNYWEEIEQAISFSTPMHITQNK